MRGVDYAVSLFYAIFRCPHLPHSALARMRGIAYSTYVNSNHLCSMPDEDEFDDLDDEDLEDLLEDDD